LNMAGTRSNIVQAKNPRTGRYIKINRSTARIINIKKSEGPYKGVPIIRKRS